MARHIDRRTALAQLGIGAIGLGAGIGAISIGTGCGLEPESKLNALGRAIVGHFEYLSLDDGVVSDFVRDYEAENGSWSPASPGAPFNRFLASTDFFQNGADETRELRYVRYHDPYVSPCYNPFAPA